MGLTKRKRLSIEFVTNISIIMVAVVVVVVNRTGHWRWAMHSFVFTFTHIYTTINNQTQLIPFHKRTSIPTTGKEISIWRNLMVFATTILGWHSATYILYFFILFFKSLQKLNISRYACFFQLVTLTQINRFLGGWIPLISFISTDSPSSILFDSTGPYFPLRI